VGIGDRGFSNDVDEWAECDVVVDSVGVMLIPI
jgi:hypothetical protein